MRRLISVTLIFSLMTMFCSSALFAQEIGGSAPPPESVPNEQSEAMENPEAGKSWMTCHASGKEDARSMGTAGSTAGGLAGGLLLGLIGAGIAVLAQSKSDPPAENLMQIQGESEECRYTYLEAFRQESQSKKRSAALTGGLIGTAIVVAIYLATYE